MSRTLEFQRILRSLPDDHDPATLASSVGFDDEFFGKRAEIEIPELVFVADSSVGLGYRYSAFRQKPLRAVLIVSQADALAGVEFFDVVEIAGIYPEKSEIEHALRSFFEEFDDVFPVGRFGLFVGILESRGVVRFDKVPAVLVGYEREIDGKDFFRFGIDRFRYFGRDFEEFFGNVLQAGAELTASSGDVAPEFVGIFRIPHARYRYLSSRMVETEVVHAFDDSGDSFGEILEFLEHVHHSKRKQGFFRLRIGEFLLGNFPNALSAVSLGRLKNERFALETVSYVLVFEIFRNERRGGLVFFEREVRGVFVIGDFRNPLGWNHGDVRFYFACDEISRMGHLPP